MENHRVIKHLFYSCLGLSFVLPFFAFAYNPETTHAALTQEIIKLFNKSFKAHAFNDLEITAIIRGSIEEDSDIRALHHFYDPVHDRGLILNGVPFVSSKQWSKSASEQAGYDINYLSKFGTITQAAFSASTDYSWDRAVHEYAWGDRVRGLESLGHILHLLEDATVPEHTRNDPHPHIFGMGSPYEDWTNQFDRDAIKVFEEVKDKRPITLNSLDDYFDQVAGYTNKHFLSKDTIYDYDFPKLSSTFSTEYKDDLPEYFVYASDTEGEYKLAKVKKRFGSRVIEYSVDDNKALSSYWSRLSRQAARDHTTRKTVGNDRALRSQRRTLMRKYGSLGPEYAILIDGIMTQCERREQLRHDPDADTKDLLALDQHIVQGIAALQKHTNTSAKEEIIEREKKAAVLAAMVLIERILSSTPAALSRIYTELIAEGLMEDPKGGARGKKPKGAR